MPRSPIEPMPPVWMGRFKPPKAMLSLWPFLPKHWRAVLPFIDFQSLESQASIAISAEKSRRAVNRTIRQMARAGLVHVEQHRTWDGGVMECCYRLGNIKSRNARRRILVRYQLELQNQLEQRRRTRIPRIQNDVPHTSIRGGPSRARRSIST